MAPELVLTVFQDALKLMTVLILIVLMPALAVGLIVAMFQAATQINEMTLSFIPKLLITLGVLVYAGPWMLNALMDYTRRLYDSIPSMIN
jgi:flagellar biosynthesis protein FliQ